MRELARRRLRSLFRFLETTKKVRVYTDFEDALTVSALVDLPGVTPAAEAEQAAHRQRTGGLGTNAHRHPARGQGACRSPGGAA